MLCVGEQKETDIMDAQRENFPVVSRNCRQLAFLSVVARIFGEHKTLRLLESFSIPLTSILLLNMKAVAMKSPHLFFFFFSKPNELSLDLREKPDFC